MNGISAQGPTASFGVYVNCGSVYETDDNAGGSWLYCLGATSRLCASLQASPLRSGIYRDFGGVEDQKLRLVNAAVDGRTVAALRPERLGRAAFFAARRKGWGRTLTIYLDDDMDEVYIKHVRV